MLVQNANIVDLWLVRLAGADQPCEADLTEERDVLRFRQIRVPQRQRRFAFRRRSLRHVLGQYRAGCVLTEGASGKPQIARDHDGRDSDLHFSVSSSSSVCAVAVSRADIGLDVEAVPPKLDMAAIVDHFIPAARAGIEGSELPSLAPYRQYLAMMRWCRLEAYIKLRGDTLHRTLFAEAERADAVEDASCHRVAVADTDHLCVVAQHRPFRMGRVFNLGYSEISHG